MNLSPETMEVKKRKKKVAQHLLEAEKKRTAVNPECCIL